MAVDNRDDRAWLADWHPTASGNAELELSAVSAGQTPALQMDFDFKGGGGFVVARRAFSRVMPEDYAVRFRLRGRGPVNHLELKLIDATGQNVWRHVIKDLQPPTRWRRFEVPCREVEFAWGPAGSGVISQLGAIEFAVVARDGGKGTMTIADVAIEDCEPKQPPTASASSALADFEASRALAGPGWTPRADDARPWIAFDFIAPRRLGGLIIEWLGAAPAGGFRVRDSRNGSRWQTVYTAARAGGKRSYVYLPGISTRFLRLEIDEPCAGAALRLQPAEFSRSIDAFWHTLAATEPRGWLPRWLHREQSLWTPIGIADGTHCALMNSDGMVEVGQGSFSIEPMLWIGGRLFSWADVHARQELLEHWMPVPSSIWETPDWRLCMTAEATAGGELRVRYRFDNLTAELAGARLFLVLRPFQVTPPWQRFRDLGGVSRIHHLEWREGTVRVDETTLIVPMTAPLGFGAMCFDDGLIAARLAVGRLPEDTAAQDPFGFATGALEFDLGAGAQQTREFVVSCVPIATPHVVGEPAYEWSARLPVSQWTGNGWINDAILAALTATAHILVTRAGPALQPGPRRYTRSWIRDGAMMSAALLRMGHVREVREFIRWYAPHQRADGFVPCCVDREGSDWLVEHDSHGQLLAVMADHHRFAPDDQFLAQCWPHIDCAVGCIERLLDGTGLMPVSVSHEGYLAQPVHSYWDDFWTLRGLRDAVSMAGALGREDHVRRWELLTARFSASLFDSINATRARRTLDFIPGSIEWADFDPTATANAITLLGVPDGLDRGAVERTFDAYLSDWRRKRSGAVPSANYTPYEIRIIGALVRLGQRDAALELLRFFLSDRRPPPWNQWPEIAWRDQNAPAHIGDLPHTWIAAEYVLAIGSLFAYEREADQSLVLAAGLAPEWIEGAGVHVNAMPTSRGNLSYALRRIDAATLRFDIGGGVSGNIVLCPPLPAPLRSVRVDGAEWPGFDAHSVTIPRTPAEVLCSS